MRFEYCMTNWFQSFLSIKCFNLDKIAFAMFNLIAISKIPLSFNFNGTSVGFLDNLNETTSTLQTLQKVLFAVNSLDFLSLV